MQKFNPAKVDNNFNPADHLTISEFIESTFLHYVELSRRFIAFESHDID
jgi:hypothetical protein